VTERFTSSVKLFYENYNANLLHVETDYTHLFPVDFPPEFRPVRDCTNTRDNYGNCGDDTAGKILSHLLVNMEGSNIDSLNPRDNDW
jgi:hypothetical protein